MSTVGTVAKLAENVVGRTLHAVTHPLETAGGLVRGAASVISGSKREDEAVWLPEQPAGMPDLPPPLPPIEGDAPTGESFATEPKVASRNAEHDGPGATEDWRDELQEAPDLAVGEHPQPESEPLMDPSLTKAVKAEAETMEKAADPVKE